MNRKRESGGKGVGWDGGGEMALRDVPLEFVHKQVSEFERQFDKC